MLQFIVDVLIRTSDIMLVAVGLSVVYSLVKFPNIAHVQYAMLGAFGTFGAESHRPAILTCAHRGVCCDGPGRGAAQCACLQAAPALRQLDRDDWLARHLDDSHRSRTRCRRLAPVPVFVGTVEPD